MLAQLRRHGIHDERVLAAMASLPRDHFVPEAGRAAAYEDRSLPIGFGQTISQPAIVGITLQALCISDGDRALDVGTGSGYQAALMAMLGATVTGYERIAVLATTASAAIRAAGLSVEVRVGDATAAIAETSFDVIAVAATAPQLPPTLVAQLSVGGRMVIPLRSEDGGERLVLLRRTPRRLVREDLGSCRFVPLIGREGFNQG